jgi:shikimate 5-dehydrogenase
MYFIGVTTRQSSINQVFPRWAERLQLGPCELRGLDFPLHAPADDYRAAVDFIKRDPLSRGALVTTHKLDLFRACHDQFDAIEPLSRALGEISSIYKRGSALHGRSVDPVNVGHALDAFLPRHHWSTGAEVVILGAGGAGTALTWHLSRHDLGGNRPKCIHVADISRARLDHLRQLHRGWPDATRLDLHLTAQPTDADALLARLQARSLVVNATGVGKDVPGSPITDAAVFPEHGLAWEFNYRGDLVFLAQARRQQADRCLQVEDGWVYFLHGWTRVIADVFECDIPTSGPLFEDLGRIAAATR